MYDGPPRTLLVRKGENIFAVATHLHDGFIIRSTALFIAVAELTGSAGRVKAGFYDFRDNPSLWRVLQKMRHGEVSRMAVTIPEGWTSKETADEIERATQLTGIAPVANEGALLPDTYFTRAGETRADVVTRMRNARNKLLEKLWPTRAPGLPYTTPEQAVTLASIVEKETAKPSERPRIAAIFVHRLEMGMRLESDPTIIYGLTGGAPLGHGLRVSELASASPYNTYRVAGLPPTPIGNPGRASLEAALHPAPGKDLYFVADGTGGHVFSDNYPEHLRNVAKWRAIETARAAAPN